MIYLILFPLLGFLLLISLYSRLSYRVTCWIGCTTVFASFLGFVFKLQDFLNSGRLSSESTWFPILDLPSMSAHFTLTCDALSLSMGLMISGIGFLIHLYSVGYMEKEASYVRYFAWLNFFMFAMLLLACAGDLFVLFLGWEGVGLASYFLIGFWTERPLACEAATKAFVVNRIGDLGFLFGLILIFNIFGTSQISLISERAGSSSLLTCATLLLFFGSMGKSAQFPLYTWLPDAMEGPTPVSALIHSATMVTAGIYLIVRLHALFIITPITLQIVGFIGGSTALFAALCAFGQTDLKRVLAFSTISQLGLMFLACGTGAFYAALFYVITHACVKALLFLSAGNMGIIELSRRRGLAHILPRTRWFFLIGMCALSGLPPFALFFSKDLILENEYLSGYRILFYGGCVTSLLTAAYMMRAYCLSFLGEPECVQKDSLHEASSARFIPMTVLSLLTLLGGGLGLSQGNLPFLENFLQEVGLTNIEIDLKSGFEMSFFNFNMVIGTLIALGITYKIYNRETAPYRALWLKNQFYFNEFVDKVCVRPLKKLATSITTFYEPVFFENSLILFAGRVHQVTQRFALLQNGQIRMYMVYIVIGASLLIFYIL